ncbi:hypothetical protein [Flavobacterium sp.]|uniref:hypothetical protein n=1 Tax=Flavobacterium sp. TaxID=239 RepID=UPI0039E56BC6
MKNLLTLHEAVILVLIKQPNRTATYEKIAEEIEKRNLFPERKGGILLSEQIKLRTSISSSKYKHMFEKISKNEIKFI